MVAGLRLVLTRIEYAEINQLDTLIEGHQIPEVGAQCGSSARWDLCGGCGEIRIPTATFHSGLIY